LEEISHPYSGFINSIYAASKMESGKNMISFDVTAIDLILAISVIVLLILYITKFSAKTRGGKYLPNESSRKRMTEKPRLSGIALRPQTDYSECPRGFGNIKKLSEDNSVSEKCIGCYKIMECYTEQIVTGV
jgi:hypothetical protein